MRAWSENYNALSLDIDREEHAEYWLKGGKSARPEGGLSLQAQGQGPKTQAKPSASMRGRM